MVTAQRVKEKIQGLIDKANAKTENTDVTLSGAVDTLIAGYGGGNADACLAMINGTDISSSDGILELPNGVTRVPKYMYSSGVDAVRTVIIPEGVKNIELSAFDAIGSTAEGASVNLNNDLQTIGNRAFYNGAYCTFNCVPQTLLTIAYGGFESVLDKGVVGFAEDIILPNIVTIGGYAFNKRRFAGSNITVGHSIKTIGANAFAFANSPSFTLTIERAEDAVTGAPWGATNATIVWTGDS
jgi:hypothetical protein